MGEHAEGLVEHIGDLGERVRVFCGDCDGEAHRVEVGAQSRVRTLQLVRVRFAAHTEYREVIGVHHLRALRADALAFHRLVERDLCRVEDRAGWARRSAAQVVRDDRRRGAQLDRAGPAGVGLERAGDAQGERHLEDRALGDAVAERDAHLGEAALAVEERGDVASLRSRAADFECTRGAQASSRMQHGSVAPAE